MKSSWERFRVYFYKDTENETYSECAENYQQVVDYER